ncbi:EpsG family protein [Bacillus toyonensis]
MLFCFEWFMNKKYTLIVKFYFIVAGLFLILFAGLRYEIGYDYISYQRIHQIIQNIPWMQNGLINSAMEINQEIGFFIINIPFENFNSMLLFISVVTLAIKYKFIFENSKYVFLSLWLYYSMFFAKYDMGLISQTIAIAIVLYSLNFIITEKKYKFIITIILASLFHYTAIIFLPTYWLATRKFSLKFMFFMTTFCFLLAFLPLTNLLSSFIVELVPWYSLYVDQISTFDFSFNVIKRMIIMLIFVYTIKKYYPTNRVYNIFLNVYFIGFLAYFAFKSIPILSDRGTVYYLLVEIFLWGIVIHHYKNIVVKLCLIVFLLTNSAYSLYNSVNLKEDALNAREFNYPYTPYKSWINK